jgi:hypothetical protein
VADLESVLFGQLVKVVPTFTSLGTVFVNTLSGYNVSMNKDCGRCEYGPTVRNIFTTDGRFDGYFCSSDDAFECPSGEYQTQAVVSVVGLNVDAYYAEISAEFTALISLLQSFGYSILQYSVKIT